MPVWFSCVIAVIGVIIPTTALIVNVKAGNKSDRKNDNDDVAARAANDALINYKLDQISSDVKDVKYDVASTKEDIRTLSERLAKVEASTKSAHNRIDELVSGGKKNEN